MLKPGMYKLSRDVVNPSPDRRKKRDWRSLPSWTEGTEFLVREQNCDGISLGYTTICLVGDRSAYSAIGPGNADRYHALESAMIQCEESDDAMLTEMGVYDNFAQWLAKSGKIERAVFRALWADYCDEDDRADRIGYLGAQEGK